MLLRDKGLQSSLQKIVTFMFQALVLVHNIVTSVWYIYFCCTALCSLVLSFYSIVTHSKAENCHFDVSCFYREAKYLHFSPVFDELIKGTQGQLCAILRPKIDNLDPFLVESSPISFFAYCIFSDTFTEHYCPLLAPKLSLMIAYDCIQIYCGDTFLSFSVYRDNQVQL